MFSSPDHADGFKEYLSSKHPKINFSIEKEKNGCLPFLDVNILRENKKFVEFMPNSKVLFLKHIKLV